MIPFLLGPNGLAELRRIRDYGDSHVIKFAELKRMMAGLSPVPGDNKEHTCVLPAKGDYKDVRVVRGDAVVEGEWPFPPFKVVYSVEEQPAATLRHLSASIVGTHRLPSPECIDMVIKELGFRPLKECVKVWLDKEPVECVNVLDFFGAIPR